MTSGKFKDLSGQVFGCWLVGSRAKSELDNSGTLRTMWNCTCKDCGKSVKIKSQYLMFWKKNDNFPRCNRYHKIERVPISYVPRSRENKYSQTVHSPGGSSRVTLCGLAIWGDIETGTKVECINCLSVIRKHERIRSNNQPKEGV